MDAGISGGINFLAQEYIKKGQDTLYLQKFDVESAHSGLYWHQYMQNILAAQSEGSTLRKTYENTNTKDSSHTFIIPVYKNMPQTTCSRPNGEGNANVESDLVRVNADPGLNLRNQPNGTTIVGSIAKDEIITRIEKATSKVNGTYWDKVKKADGTTGYAARETYENEANYKLYLVPIGEQNNNKIKGDVDGDGNITANDYSLIKSDIMGNRNLTNEERTRADYDGDGNVTANDYVLIKKYIMEK